MITDIKKDEFGIEGRMHCNLWNCDIDVVIEDYSEDESLSLDKAVEFAEKCAEAFNNLSPDMIDAICRSAKAYCLDFMESCDVVVPVSENTAPADMLKYINPHVLIVDLPEEDEFKGIIGYHVECSCEWEEEHGLEFTVRDGKLIYMGSFNDCSPWYDYTGDSWNYV